MFNQIYAYTSMVRVALDEIVADPVSFIKQLERGDADSSGSTMRLAGVVALVLAVVALIAGTVFALATAANANIKNPFAH